jgi:hypothetical protein
MKSNLRFCATLESELLNDNLNAKCSEYKLENKLNSFSVSIKILYKFYISRWIKKKGNTSGLLSFAWPSELIWASYIQI